MKTEIFALATLIIGVLLFLKNTQKDAQLWEAFLPWMEQHQKKYDDNELTYRFTVFKNNYNRIQQHNVLFNKGLSSYALGINHFADLTNQQYSAILLLRQKPQITQQCTSVIQPVQKPPESLDWTSKATTSVKNQGGCASCWAFSAVGAVQGQYSMSKGKLQQLSTQQILDCSDDYGNQGCNGGLMSQSFFYIKDQGITTQQRIPYRAQDYRCVYSQTMKIFTITDCALVVPKSELAMIYGLQKGPVSAAIQANSFDFQFYKKGILDFDCGTQLDHGVLVVGYGSENGKKFWNVKNTYGADWGEKGFVRLVRKGDGDGQCGILLLGSMPTVKK